jgi:hypothetical protein
VKAGLVELTDDDRAVIYGGLLATAIMLRGEQRDEALVHWRRRGRRAFQTEADEKVASGSPHSPSPP